MTSSPKLDLTLVKRAAYTPPRDVLTQSQRIAANLLWRSGVRISVLTKLLGCAKNTLYNTALTGGGAYPSDKAVEINQLVDRLIDKLGADETIRQYVPAALINAVNAANKAIAGRR